MAAYRFYDANRFTLALIHGRPQRRAVARYRRTASPPPFVDRTWLFVNDVVREQVALAPA